MFTKFSLEKKETLILYRNIEKLKKQYCTGKKYRFSLEQNKRSLTKIKKIIFLSKKTVFIFQRGNDKKYH